MNNVAVLIDGSFFLKRLSHLRPDTNRFNARAVRNVILGLVRTHLESVNEVVQAPDSRSLLYRAFYYDARPYQGKEHRLISGDSKDYAKSKVAQFRLALFEELRRASSITVRLGEVRKTTGWVLEQNTLKRLIRKEIRLDDLTDDDFNLDLRQKAVDLRIGMDITYLTLKKQVDTIVIVAGDADFVPAAKLARREGACIILDSLGLEVSREIYEHIDRMQKSLSRQAGATQHDRSSGNDHR